MLGCIALLFCTFQIESDEYSVDILIETIIVPPVCLGIATLISFGMLSRSTFQYKKIRLLLIDGTIVTNGWYYASIYFFVTFLLSLVSVLVFYLHAFSTAISLALVIALLPWVMYMLAIVGWVVSSLKGLAKSICNRLSSG